MNYERNIYKWKSFIKLEFLTDIFGGDMSRNDNNEQEKDPHQGKTRIV